VIRHMAHNLIRRAPGKQSLRVRRKVAGWMMVISPAFWLRNRYSRFPCYFMRGCTKPRTVMEAASSARSGFFLPFWRQTRSEQCKLLLRAIVIRVTVHQHPLGASRICHIG
jgi:hypothetical protein